MATRSSEAPITPARPQRPTTEDLDGFLAWRLVQVGKALGDQLVQAIAGYGLGPTEFGVLVHLATGATYTQSELARSVLVRPQSMGALITRLTERGLVERTGPGGRGRRTPIVLTEAGAQLAERAWTAVTGAHQPEQLGLGPQDAADLDRILRALPHPHVRDERTGSDTDTASFHDLPDRTA